MSINSKTKIGGEGEHNDRMMRAAASGQEAVAHASDQVLAQRRANFEQTQQMAGAVGSSIQQGQQFNEQKREFDVTAQQRQDQTDLEAAKAGFERNAGPQGQQGQEGGSTRQQQLEAEMRKGEDQPKIGPLDAESQQRLNDQVKQPMEMDANGTWRPTAERKAAQQSDQEVKRFKADTERIRALAYRDQVGVSAQKALAAGDHKAYDEYAKQLAAQPNATQKSYDRLMQGKVNDNDWGELSKLAQGGPDSDPSLMADLKSKNFTPRVAAFMRAQVSKDALSSIVLSKGDTSNLKIDWTAPKMREFADQRANLNAYMGSNPALSQLAFINSTEDKMRFLNVLAAAQVLTGMTQAPSPTGGMTPATQAPGGGAPPQAPHGPMLQHSQQGASGAGAVSAARAGGASPQEALQAGQNANPTGRFGENVIDIKH